MAPFKTLKSTIIPTVSALAFAATFSTPASAEMLWDRFSLSYLYGSDYKFVEDGEMSVVTIEHASGHSWGDNFLFIDRTMPSKGDSSFYGELSPRLSIGKVSDSDLSFGPMTDLLVATTWEMGDGFDNYLYGIGTALSVPGFRYFNVNLYKANNDLSLDDEQLTLNWGAPFNIGSSEFLIDGFLDWSSSAEDHASEMNFTPQIKWNVGKLMNTKAPLYLGVEYSHWNNKFGVDGVNERNVSLLATWVF
ncbi:MAG: outer membrane protein OmpK [Motiliproteus sp.]